jgi:predicted N-acetyltransferase YhbS
MCVLNPLNPEKTKTQLMQMAVETNQQRKGIGKLLVEELLSFANPMELKK